MDLHRIAPDTGRNVRCICGAEYSEARNAARHVDRENAAAEPRRVEDSTGRGMQAQVNIKNPTELDRVLRYTDGEYPVSGDLSRVTYKRWTEFSLPSVWTRRGVHA